MPRISEQKLQGAEMAWFLGYFCPFPFIDSTYTRMDQTKLERPSSSFIYCSGGKNHFFGIWDHEFQNLSTGFHATLSRHLPVKWISRERELCSETRTCMIPPENCEREWWTKLNSEDQSQTPGFYLEGYSKYWNTEYSKRVRSVYTHCRRQHLDNWGIQSRLMFHPR